MEGYVAAGASGGAHFQHGGKRTAARGALDPSAPAEGLWETEQFGALRVRTRAVVSIVSNKWSFLQIAGHRGYGPDAKTPRSVVFFWGKGE